MDFIICKGLSLKWHFSPLYSFLSLVLLLFLSHAIISSLLITSLMRILIFNLHSYCVFVGVWVLSGLCVEHYIMLGKRVNVWVVTCGQTLHFVFKTLWLYYTSIWEQLIQTCAIHILLILSIIKNINNMCCYIWGCDATKLQSKNRLCGNLRVIYSYWLMHFI